MTQSELNRRANRLALVLEENRLIRSKRNLLLNVVLEFAQAEGIDVSPEKDRSKLPLIWQKLLSAIDENTQS